MNTEQGLHKIVLRGVGAGILWGWIAFLLNIVTGVFIFEKSNIPNLIAFSVFGSIFGIVMSCLMAISYDKLPFENSIKKGVLLSVFMWALLQVGGVFLSLLDKNSYHLIPLEIIQGFILAVILGGMLGKIGKWKIFPQD